MDLKLIVAKLSLATAVLLGGPVAAQSDEKFITLASTTSTEQSGLFGHLLPLFKTATGISVRVVAVGTGQALDMARRGDADALLVHDTAAEEKFVADGFAARRWPVMYNDFVLIGPGSDPAKVQGADISKGLALLANQPQTFVSRGDKSGTHAAEMRLWKDTGIEPTAALKTAYKACGCGMGPALNMAASLDAYVLADRGTWLAFKNRANLAVLVEGDKRLFNPYGVLVVSAARHPHVKTALAQQFVDWITGPAGQAAIGSFVIGGQALFFPQAGKR